MGEPTADNDDDVITFTPYLLLAGIAYHVIDEDWAKTFDFESAEVALRRIKSIPHPTIRRGEWAQMGNGTRLHWLKFQANTGVRIVGQTAYFTERFDPPKPRKKGKQK